jgi:trehalose 6-phosphate synthase
MNLVAKEYVAAQNPFDPGVLVLSNYAGAARQLEAALLVNPNDIDDIAKNIGIALKMSLDERRERWEEMMKNLRTSTVHTWFANFVNALDGIPSGLIIKPPANDPVGIGGKTLSV